jgi:hypothetical protein
MSDKLSLASELAALNSKRRSFYDELSDEEKKKFSAYLLLKYGANIEGSSELQEWYLRAINEYVNINFFELNKHPKLQWLTLTTVSPKFGNQRHYWLNAKKKSTSNTSKKIKFLLKLYPTHKLKDIELLAQLNTDQDLIDIATEMGMSDADIKKELT